jgi:hypothetical protein
MRDALCALCAYRSRLTRPQVALYDAAQARLLGTLDTQCVDVRCSADAIRAYFVSFLLDNADAIEPLFSDDAGAPPKALPARARGASGAEALAAPQQQLRLPPAAAVQWLGPGTVAYSGYYCLKLRKTKHGETTESMACAKFTFVYRRDAASGALRILLHNSGLTPAGIVAAPADD